MAIERTPRHRKLMMKATIRRFHSPDVSDLESWTPADPTCFGFLLQVLVGPQNSEGEEAFDFIVCTPDWLKEKLGEQAIIVGHHHLLMFQYDLEGIKKVVAEIVAKASGSTWRDVASEIARYGRWEFENYNQ